MRTAAGGSAYQFLIAGVPEIARILRGSRRRALAHLQAERGRSAAVKKIRVTYHFPAWTG